MTSPRTLRGAVVAALLLVPFAAPAASPAPAVPVPAAGSPDRALRPADVIEPPLPVEAFPGQVKEACGIWKELTWPRASRATDHPVVNTRLVIRGANVYHNRSGDLPAAGHYREYDVNPRVPGTRRDAERLVRDTDTTAVWYTADHYANFREISSGCE